ncbi:MAG: HipA N-terminal domain-containing protein [Leeuwenhoekiella sp.]
MKEFFRTFFNKSQSKTVSTSPQVDAKFVVKIDDLDIGYLNRKNNLWQFQYSEKFKNQTRYHRLVGFSDLNKVYQSDILWPFFKIRIPGLKQPQIKEIIEKDNIDENDEALLLRRFGRRAISNRYLLESI